MHIAQDKELRDGGFAFMADGVCPEDMQPLRSAPNRAAMRFRWGSTLWMATRAPRRCCKGEKRKLETRARCKVITVICISAKERGIARAHPKPQKNLLFPALPQMCAPTA